MGGPKNGHQCIMILVIRTPKLGPLTFRNSHIETQCPYCIGTWTNGFRVPLNLQIAQNNAPVSQNRQYRQSSPKIIDPFCLHSCSEMNEMLGPYFVQFGGPGVSVPRIFGNTAVPQACS